MFRYKGIIYVISRRNVSYLREPYEHDNKYSFGIMFSSGSLRGFVYETQDQCNEAFEYVQNQLFPEFLTC